MLLMQESPLDFQDSLNKYIPKVQLALEYVTSTDPLDSLKYIYDKQSPNRLFIDAAAIAMSADLIGDTTTYLPISRDLIEQGIVGYS